MPQLDPASFPSQLFWLVVCFGTMLLVLSVFVLPRITRTLTARQGQIDGDLEAAGKLRVDAEAALAAYDAALQQARNNALALAQDMRAEIQAETDRQKAELDARLAEEAQKAEARLQAVLSQHLFQLLELFENTGLQVVDRERQSLLFTPAEQRSPESLHVTFETCFRHSVAELFVPDLRLAAPH